MGCSNPHPHSQAWSLSEVPQLASTELDSFVRYAQSSPPPSDAPKGPGDLPCLLCDYVHAELGFIEDEDSRIVFKNQDWVALVPWWAVWPFEILRESQIFASNYSSKPESLRTQFCLTAGTFPQFLTSQIQKCFLSQKHFRSLQSSTTIFSRHPLRTPWAFTRSLFLGTALRLTRMTLTTSTFTFTHLYSGAPRSASSLLGGYFRFASRVYNY
jgi:hypothetical protein